MKLIEVVPLCAILALFCTASAAVVLSYKSVSTATDALRTEMAHDAFIVRGVPEFTHDGQLDAFAATCAALWPDDEFFAERKLRPDGTEVVLCEWTHGEKRKRTECVPGRSHD